MSPCWCPHSITSSMTREPLNVSLWVCVYVSYNSVHWYTDTLFMYVRETNRKRQFLFLAAAASSVTHLTSLVHVPVHVTCTSKVNLSLYICLYCLLLSVIESWDERRRSEKERDKNISTLHSPSFAWLIEKSSSFFLSIFLLYLSRYFSLSAVSFFKRYPCLNEPQNVCVFRFVYGYFTFKNCILNTFYYAQQSKGSLNNIDLTVSVEDTKFSHKLDLLLQQEQQQVKV